MNKSVTNVCLTLCFLIAVYPQQPVEKSDLTSQGVALYERGETDGAVKTLREALKKSKEDSRAWHYLGCALARQGKPKEAREAFEKAISRQSRSLNEALEGPKDREWRDDQLSSLKALLASQIESRRKLLEVVSDQVELGKGQLDLEKSRIQADCIEQNTKLIGEHRVLQKSDLKIQKPKILFRTQPAFPEAARHPGANGIVVLKAVFAPDGLLKYLEPIRSSGDLFTQEAIKAALKTRFQPGSICGKPVGYSLQLEYTFNIGL